MAFIPSHGYAPFWKRTVAAIVDGILWTVAYYLVGVIVVTLAVLMGGGWGYSAVTINTTGIFTGWLYSALMQSSPWQATLGKMPVDIRVCDFEGNSVDFRRATGRYFGKFISMVLVFAGFRLPLFGSDRQALHDRMAGTLIINRP